MHMCMERKRERELMPGQVVEVDVIEVETFVQAMYFQGMSVSSP